MWITFFAQLTSVIGFGTIFPFLPLYVNELGSTWSGFSVEFLAGLVFSAQAFTMMIASPIWGSLSDRFGRKLMIQRATFGGAIVLAMMGFADSGETLVILRAIQGAVTGVIAAANALVAASVPREKVGFGLGLLQVGRYGGIALGPILGGLLADAFGYRYSFILTASLLFIAGVLVLFGVKEEHSAEEKEAHRKRSFLQDWGHVLKAPGVTTAYIIRFMVSLGQVLLLPIAPLFVFTLLPVGAPVNLMTGLVSGTSGAASMLTSVTLGKWGDRFGHRRILLVSSLVAAAAYLPTGLVTQVWQLIVLLAIAGGALGGIIVSAAASMAKFTDKGEEGAVFGLDNAILASSRVVAPLIGTGLAYQIGFRPTLSLTAVLFVMIFFLALWLLPQASPRSALQPAPSD